MSTNSFNATRWNATILGIKSLKNFTGVDKNKAYAGDAEASSKNASYEVTYFNGRLGTEVFVLR